MFFFVFFRRLENKGGWKTHPKHMYSSESIDGVFTDILAPFEFHPWENDAIWLIFIEWVAQPPTIPLM